MNKMTKQITRIVDKLENYGRCSITIKVDLEDDNGKKYLSITGEVTDLSVRSRYDNFICGGQCYEEIAKMLPEDQKIQRIVEVWKKYHLNDMVPSCEHQRELGWDEIAKKLVQVKRPWRDKMESVALCWLHQKEHEEGILCKPCPVCGYKYGEAWNYMPIPKEIIEEIESW